MSVPTPRGVETQFYGENNIPSHLLEIGLRHTQPNTEIYLLRIELQSQREQINLNVSLLIYRFNMVT